MKAQMINSVAIALFASLFALTSCNDDGLVKQVTPQGQEYSQSYTHNSSMRVEAPNEEPAVYNEQSINTTGEYQINMQGLARTSINRQRVDGHTHAANPDSPNSRAQAPTTDMWKYNVSGEANMDAGSLGQVKVQFIISNDPYTGESDGTLTIRDANNSASLITFRLQGSSEMSELASNSGYQFRLSQLIATDQFTDIDRAGSGSISIDVAEQSGLEGQLLTKLQVNLTKLAEQF